MTSQGPRVRSMKARRQSTCRCGRFVQVGDRITRLEGAWLCLACAIAISTREAQGASQARTGA